MTLSRQEIIDNILYTFFYTPIPDAERTRRVEELGCTLLEVYAVMRCQDVDSRRNYKSGYTLSGSDDEETWKTWGVGGYLGV